MTNFKIDNFKGTLKDLLEECNPHLSDENVTKSFKDAHSWLIDQFDHVDDNIFPVRKFQGYKSRGQLENLQKSKSNFMAVDNEPFCFFYSEWIAKNSFRKSLKNLFLSKTVPASWNCDGHNKYGMKFSGVKTTFRENGLKLAHINDAGVLENIESNSISNNAIKTRYLRSLSPLNVFLFPNYRVCEIKSNYRPMQKDWAEDYKIRQIALSFLINRMEIDVELLNIFSPQIKYLENWEQLATEIPIEVIPKSIKRSKSSTEDNNKTIQKHYEPNVTMLNSCPKTTKESSIESMIDVYREWRRKFPNVIRLDGAATSKPSNPSPWLKFKVSGYTENHYFTSSNGIKFVGDDYNGIVNFHGDARCEKIDLFIELFEQAETYHDILTPNETEMRKGITKPKFALKGYEDKVDGFYLYHDEWSKNRNKAA